MNDWPIKNSDNNSVYISISAPRKYPDFHPAISLFWNQRIEKIQILKKKNEEICLAAYIADDLGNHLEHADVSRKSGL